MKPDKINIYLISTLAIGLASCSNEKITDTEITENESLPEWYYAGGELGTTLLSTSNAFEQPAPAIERQGLYQSFKNGEALFEKPFMANQTGVRSGLGPAYVRSSCIHCHPNYGHGTRIPEGSFNTNEIGNGCLLVVHDPSTEAYVSWLAGMPQSHAVAPFKAPIDESKITVRWKNATDEWDNRFDDGESYELQYPEVSMPLEAIYVVNQGYQLPGEYAVKLESTIGVYGTGLLDAITEEDILAQYRQEESTDSCPTDSTQPSMPTETGSLCMRTHFRETARTTCDGSHTLCRADPFRTPQGPTPSGTSPTSHVPTAATITLTPPAHMRPTPQRIPRFRQDSKPI